MSVHSLKATFAGIAPFQASAFNDSVGVMQQIPIVQTRVRLLEFLESAVAKRLRTRTGRVEASKSLPVGGASVSIGNRASIDSDRYRAPARNARNFFPFFSNTTLPKA
jgi:hypothetical protein